jgi:Zn-dependent protease
MFSFNLFAIPVRVEPWFWITMAFLGGGLNARDSSSILSVIIFVIAGFISILVHELGHALTVRKFGLLTGITLHGFGGYTTFLPGRLTRTQSFLVTAAGPGLQVLLALLLILLSRFVPIPETSLLNLLVTDLVLVSLIWAFLNCLPIYPMDGGQMMAAILGPRREHLVYLISIFVAVFIGLTCFIFFRQLLLPIVMALFVWQNWQMHRNHTRR